MDEDDYRYEPDDLEEYNRNEADDYRHELDSDEVSDEPLHARLISVADGSATPFLAAIDRALADAEGDGLITEEQNHRLYQRLYNALVVEYEDTDGEGADE